MTELVEYLVFSFRNGKDSPVRKLYRKIYGFSAKGVRYPGLLSKCNGLKLGGGSLIIPAACGNAVTEALTASGTQFFVLKVLGAPCLLNENGPTG